MASIHGDFGEPGNGNTTTDTTVHDPAEMTEQIGSVSSWHTFSGDDNENRYHRLRCGAALAVFNAQGLATSMKERTKAWKELVAPFATVTTLHEDEVGMAPLTKSPFYLDYGNVQVASSTYIHRNVYIGDNPHRGATVEIGEGAFIGPGAQILTIKHDVDWRSRGTILASACAARTIVANDVFIGAGACIMPGVVVAKGCVIGAGAVVTKSVPAGHVAAGNPARLIRKVALDIADAPGLKYELLRGRMVVLHDDPAKACEISSGDNWNDDDPVGDCKAKDMGQNWCGHAWARRAAEECSFAGTSPETTPGNASMTADTGSVEAPNAMAQDAKTDLSPTTGLRMEVEIGLFLAAIGLAWCVLHAALY
ncbi:hypothetical protein LTR62_002309 [Meristemomyces frigidus]|uniref:Mannose-1-phosphate guanylyltransferase n=1 Tax=Meristemomyces frigidus TaxID=1508187 RepID=A0AAN7YHV4_9PEZI|nr:hypothetical protein LTR62_002309 [Meristemomyces frigidus]